MEEKEVKICNNVYVHLLKTNKFKTSFVAGFYLSKLNRDTITINSLIPAVLTRGTSNLPTAKEINTRLDSMYGGVLDASSDKIGDFQAIQFYITTISDKYALNDEKLLSDSIKLMLDVIYNPKLVDGKFDENFVNGEKDNLRELIKSRINDKSSYAISRLVEEMFKDEAYGAYKYGRIEDLPAINSENLYEQYKWILSNSEIHFYICSESELDYSLFDVCKAYESEEEIKIKDENKLKLLTNPNAVIEKQDVTQGKLVLGYNVDIDIKKDLYKMQVYNAILGGSSNSKMFQNVREKNSLAYTAYSRFLKHKNLLIIFAGIELNKYDKALSIIKEQVEDMKAGNFTDRDILDAKVFITNVMRSYEDSQDVLIDLSMGQHILRMNDSIEEMINSINQVTKEDIVNIANKVFLNTKYFLTGEEEGEDDD